MKLETLFSGMQATCAVVVTALAVWAFFFTDIPEALIRQLRSDVADSREELSDLRRERRQLEGAVESLRDELDLARAERSRLETTLEELRSERNQLEALAQRLRKQRRRYFENTKEDVLSSFFGGVISYLVESRAQLSLARTLPEFEEWARREPAVPTFLGIAPAFMFDRHSKWKEERPEPWRGGVSRLTLRLLGDRRSAASEEDAEDASEADSEDTWGGILAMRKARRLIWRSHIEAAEDFRKEITVSGVRVFDGAELMRSQLKSRSLDLLLPEDRSRLERSVEAFVEQNTEALSKPLRLSLDPGWDFEDLRVGVERVERAVQGVESVLPPFRQQLRASW